jgi:hypothetical protein
LVSFTVVGRNGTTARVRLGDGLELTVASADLPAGTTTALVSIRPEKIHISKQPLVAENTFEARIQEEIFQGQRTSSVWSPTTARGSTPWWPTKVRWTRPSMRATASFAACTSTTS